MSGFWRPLVREFAVSWHLYILAAAIGLFAVVKLWFLAPRFSDGNAYLYMAKLVADGAVPYRDFFYASPPLIVYAAAWVGTIGGFSWRIFGWLPVLLTAADAVIIYCLGFTSRSRLTGLAAAIGYLFSFVVLATTDFYSGVHLSLTLTLLGALAWQRSYPFGGGVLIGFGMLGKLYMAVLFGALVLAAAAARRWSEVVRLLAGGGLVLAAAAALFWWLAGQAIIDQVVLNHLAKIEGIPKERIAAFFVRHDALLLLGALLALAARQRPPVLVLAPMAAAAFFLLFRDVYYLHLKMLAPWLALLAGWAVAPLEFRWRGLTLTGWRVAGAAALVIFVGSGLVQYVREQAHAAVITDFAAIVETVRRLTPPGQPLYGDFTVTPLLALAADRPVFNSYADINPIYFATGVFNYKQRAAEIARAQVRTIITKSVVAPDGRIVGGQERVLPASFFSEHCRRARVFPLERDYEHNAVVLWECRYERIES